jgi:hypothetical protein
MRGVPSAGGSEASFVRTSQRRASPPTPQMGLFQQPARRLQVMSSIQLMSEERSDCEEGEDMAEIPRIGVQEAHEKVIADRAPLVCAYEDVEIMGEARRTYIPAAGYDWFLPLYDPLVKLLSGDSARRALLDQAAIRPGHRVLDIGCGTGSLVILIKCLHPDVDVVGLDPGEVRRVLERGGYFHMLDFGGPESSGDGFLARLLHSSHRLRDNAEGRVLTFMSQAGFADPRKVSHRAMLFGRVAYYQASVPTPEASAARRELLRQSAATAIT